VRRAAGVGARLWTASVARSIGAELCELVHDGPATAVQTWWGPVLRVTPGDVVRYFMSPAGVEVEWVESAPRGGTGDVARV
jgi:hypothetical protein